MPVAIPFPPVNQPILRSSAVVPVRCAVDGDAEVGMHFRHGTSSLRNTWGVYGGKAEDRAHRAATTGRQELGEESGPSAALDNGKHIR